MIEKLKEIIKTKLPSRKMGVVVNVSGLTISNIRNNKYYQVEHDIDYEKLKIEFLSINNDINIIVGTFKSMIYIHKDA